MFAWSPEHDISGVEIHDHGLAAARPQLEALVLYGGTVILTPQTWARLRTYAVKSGSLGKACLHVLAKSGFPELVDFEIWFGTVHTEVGE